MSFKLHTAFVTVDTNSGLPINEVLSTQKNHLWVTFLSAVLSSSTYISILLNIACMIVQHHLQVCSFSRHIVHILQRAGCWGPAGLLPHLTSPLSLSTDTRLTIHTSPRVWSSAAAGAHKIQTLQQDTSLSLSLRCAPPPAVPVSGSSGHN